MSVMVTGGRTRVSAAKVYDRLRKRSLRAMNKRGGVSYEDMVSRTTRSPYIDGSSWNGTDHMAYVAGVRDALNAISSASQDA